MITVSTSLFDISELFARPTGAIHVCGCNTYMYGWA
jgi:hypothetical protein